MDFSHGTRWYGVTAIITVSPVRGTIALFPENVIALHHFANNTSPFFQSAISRGK